MTYCQKGALKEWKKTSVIAVTSFVVASRMRKRGSASLMLSAIIVPYNSAVVQRCAADEAAFWSSSNWDLVSYAAFLRLCVSSKLNRVPR